MSVGCVADSCRHLSIDGNKTSLLVSADAEFPLMSNRPHAWIIAGYTVGQHNGTRIE